ncbi:MAG: ArnT family glycosyltransferase, partial [Gemmataceae bacterium]
MPPACPVRSALPACEAAPCADESLRWTDVLLLFLFCVICHGPAVLAGRSLSGHEAVVPQCVREMLADGDWLIPKCGGFAWLERPPLSHWFMALVVKSVGSDSDRAMRLSAALAGAATVCLVGWLASLLLGR